MKVTTVIDMEREEEIVVYTHGDSDTAERIRRIFASDERLVGYRGESISVLNCDEVYCFFTEHGHTYALCADGRYLIKLPLYKVEEMLGDDFLRINQSCIVCISAIEGFSASIGGSLSVKIKGGFLDYVSRRQVKSVKERFGIK